jgi:hypothetical protein
VTVGGPLGTLDTQINQLRAEAHQKEVTVLARRHCL